MDYKSISDQCAFYVLIYDSNKRDFEFKNIIRENLIEEIYNNIKKNNITNELDLKGTINSWLIYNYYHKSEYEIMVGNLNETCSKKYDTYSRVKPNLDLITEKIMKEMEIKF